MALQCEPSVGMKEAQAMSHYTGMVAHMAQNFKETRKMMTEMEPVTPTSYRGKQYTLLEHLMIVMVTTLPATGKTESGMSFLAVPGQRIFLLKMVPYIPQEQEKLQMPVIGLIRLAMIFQGIGERQRP